jgi:hypothetical protein
LVADALDKFDDAPLPASVRRALRVAQLSGDTSVATRLLMELDYQKGGERLESLADPIHLEYRDNRALGKAGSLFGFPDGVEHDITPLEALLSEPMPLINRVVQCHSDRAQKPRPHPRTNCGERPPSTT